MVYLRPRATGSKLDTVDTANTMTPSTAPPATRDPAHEAPPSQHVLIKHPQFTLNEQHEQSRQYVRRAFETANSYLYWAKAPRLSLPMNK